MRCFPHCCPRHRERSYCGAPLHVRVLAPDPRAQRFAIQVIVYGRFERHEDDPKARDAHVVGALRLRLGQRVTSASITGDDDQRELTDPWIHAQVVTSSREVPAPLLKGGTLAVFAALCS